jgi:predicted porin
MAGRVSVKDLAGFGASFAYGTSDSTDSLVAGMGNGADSLYTGTVIRGGSNTYAADMDSYLLAATYDFAQVGVPGLTVLGQYAVAEQGTAMGGNDYTTYHLGATYAFSGALKGFSTTLQFESQERERPVVDAKNGTTDEIRFMANYKF